MNGVLELGKITWGITREELCEANSKSVDVDDTGGGGAAK